jgi:alpha-glucosidase
VISPDLIAQPGTEDQVNNESSDLDFTWSNDPTFSFQVYRRSTGDSLFSSNGTVLVFEDQFVEIKSSMPQNYNLNGLGERISSLRLGNNYTATLYASGASDPVDGNIYGVHPFYLDTRYFETTPDGKQSLVASPDADPTKQYSSSVHGVYYRNVHPHEVVLEPTTLTWRTLGGSVELYFFSGPSQPEVTKQYLSVVGLPALQQYW